MRRLFEVERRGRLASDLEMQRTTWQWVLWVFFCPFIADGILEKLVSYTSMAADRKKPQEKSAFFSQKTRTGADKQDRKLVANNHSSPVKLQKTISQPHQQRLSGSLHLPPTPRPMPGIMRQSLLLPGGIRGEVGSWDIYPHLMVMRPNSRMSAEVP